MHVIKEAMLFTEITLEECATVSGGNDPVSSSNANATVTITINNNPGTTSTVGTGGTGGTGGTVGTGGTGGTNTSGKLLPVLDAVGNFQVVNI